MPKKEKLIKKEENKVIREKFSLNKEEVKSIKNKIEKNEEKMDFSQLKEFLDGQKREDSPTLKETNPPKRNSKNLEENFIQNQVSTNKLKDDEEDDSFKYNPAESKPEEAKYIRYEDKDITKITPIREMEKIRRENPLERKEIKFENPHSEKENIEKYFPVRKMDKEKIEREKPFEKKEIKYTPGKY